MVKSDTKLLAAAIDIARTTGEVEEAEEAEEAKVEQEKKLELKNKPKPGS